MGCGLSKEAGEQPHAPTAGESGTALVKAVSTGPDGSSAAKVGRQERLGRVSSAEPVPRPDDEPKLVAPAVVCDSKADSPCDSKPDSPCRTPSIGLSSVRSGKKRSDSAYASGGSVRQAASPAGDPESSQWEWLPGSSPFSSTALPPFDGPNSAPGQSRFAGPRTCSEPAVREAFLLAARAPPPQPQARAMAKHQSAPLLDQLLTLPLQALHQAPALPASLARPRVVGYLPPPKPEDEALRQSTVERLNLLQWPQSEPQLQILSNLIATAFKCKTAAVSIVDEEWVLLKTAAPKAFAIVEKHNFIFPRSLGLTGWLCLPECRQIMVVDDPVSDIRFRHDWMMKSLAWFAGAPLIASNGQRVGGVCAFDTVPHRHGNADYALLATITELVMMEMERDAFVTPYVPGPPSLEPGRSQDHLLAKDKRLVRTVAALQRPVFLVQVTGKQASIVFISTSAARSLGMSVTDALDQSLWDLFELEGGTGEVPDELDELTRVAHALPQFMALQGRVVLQFRNACTSTSTLMDRPVVGVPAYADVLQEHEAAVPAFQTYLVSVFAVTPDMEKTGEPLQESLDRVKVATSLWDPEELFASMRLGPLLGKGGYAKVLRGTWNEKTVAVKVLVLRLSHHRTSFDHNGPQGRLKQINEAQIGLQFLHPNIVHVYAYAARTINLNNIIAKATQQDMQTLSRSLQEMNAPEFLEVWLVLHLCRVGSLQEASDKGHLHRSGAAPGSLPDLSFVLATALDIANGMACIHAHDVIHSDLTPKNVLLDLQPDDPRGFIAKISDFGLSHMYANGPILTKTVGTVCYAAPELLTSGMLTRAADVYSFGSILWSMWTGQVPWAGLSDPQIMMAASHGRGLAIPADAPADYQALMRQCLHPDHKRRPMFKQIASALGQQLNMLEAHQLDLHIN